MNNLSDINNFIENELFDNTVEIYFRSLNISDKNILKEYYKNLLIVIYYSFFENNTGFDIFVNKLKLNRYNDAVSIMLLLLPFINSNEDTNNIKSFNDMVNKKYKEVDIKKDSPKYVYTNFQYQRCNRGRIEEINFSYEYLKNNFLFLVDAIKKVSNKLYVNWIDILPHNMIDYRNEKLYINTQNKFNAGTLIDYDFLNKDFKIDENLINNLTCLSVGDIYETVTNEFYYQIKKVKWLIYDIYMENIGGPVPLVILLNQIFRDVLMGNLYLEWEQLNPEAQDNFSEKWSMLLSLAKTNDEFNDGQTIISSRNVKNIIKSFIIFFNNYYVGIDKLVEKKKYTKLDFGLNVNDDPEEGEEDVLGRIRMSKIIKTLSQIDHSHIYKFITDSFDILKLSWYSLKLCDKKKEKFLLVNEYFAQNNFQTPRGLQITIKNIYNYSKSFCHIQYNGQFTPLPRFFQSLTKDQKDIINNRLYNIGGGLNWFNISRNIASYTRTNPAIYHAEVDLFFRQNLITHVFESLISRGILSKLVPNLKVLYDINAIPEDKKRELVPLVMKDYIFKTDPTNNTWTNSYYFLTNSTYQHMRVMTIDSTQINYFDYNSSVKSGAWYSAYAVNWVSQINFFNKFLNNRVIYTTGSTGVGKSTQVPKLLLYAQKAILYNSTSAIVCTQPRKTPTTKNAETVSTELGVPISTKMKENYYVQFKYKDAKHIKNTNHLSLKFVTDGSLIMELTNPILKNELKTEPFFANNKYDIVIVDEAHEHNKNMDMILTIMKDIALYNNTIKLVIISATMDDDEPIYRRFYRDINDNRMYPLNYSLRPNELDRINVDRRFHISPPGQTTKYKIDETYINSIPVGLQDPAKLALDIIKKSTKGDILIFQPGVGEIAKVIEELNKNLPAEVIALPYHSELKEKQRTFIENIHKTLKNLRIGKDVDFNQVENPEKGNSVITYKRAIIVATNIAEASITIPTLFYVIETGTQKTAYYDFKKKNTKLEKRDISESSRLQRKGRVGRTGSGHVYYLYEKGKMENNKTIYSICIQDIAAELFRKIFNNSSEKILLSLKNDPNNPKNNLVFANLRQIFNKFYTNFVTYFNIDQYFDYFGNTLHYDYENYENPTYYYENGYSIYNLNDYDGKFYIIHPEELEIKRNIIGTIMENKSKFNKLENNMIESEKLQTFWDSLRDSLFLDYNNNNIVKLPIGDKFQKLQEFFGFEDEKLFKAFMYSFSLGVTEEVIRLVCFLQSIRKLSGDMLITVTIDGKYVNQLDNLKKLIGIDFRGDFDAILYILNLFHNKLDSLNIVYDKDLNHESKIYATEISRFLNENFTEANNQYAKFNLSLSYTGTTYISDEDYLKVRESDQFVEFVERSFNSKRDEIKQFLNSLYLDYDVFKDYFKRYENLKNKYYLYKNKSLSDEIKEDQYKYLDELTDLLGKTVSFKNYDSYEKVLTCFLVSNPYNMVSNILGTKNYLYMYEPIQENIYQLATTTKLGKKLDNLVNPIYLSKYLYYHTVDVDGINISLVNYVNPKLVENLYRIYNSSNAGKKLLSLIKQDYIPIKEDTRVFSSNYKNTLNELNKEYEDNTKLASYNPKKIKDIEKIDLFNKKIKEIMNFK
jgi:hypothetical protein